MAHDTITAMLADKVATEKEIAALLAGLISRLPPRVMVEEVEIENLDGFPVLGGERRFGLGVNIKLRL